jgi:hypothetical protein
MAAQINNAERKNFSQVSEVIRTLWPDAVFAVFVWDRNSEDRVEVNYISNSEPEESASLLRDLSRHLRRMAALAKGRGRVGNVCILIALLFLLLLTCLAVRPGFGRIYLARMVRASQRAKGAIATVHHG